MTLRRDIKAPPAALCCQGLQRCQYSPETRSSPGTCLAAAGNSKRGAIESRRMGSRVGMVRDTNAGSAWPPRVGLCLITKDLGLLVQNFKGEVKLGACLVHPFFSVGKASSCRNESAMFDIGVSALCEEVQRGSFDDWTWFGEECGESVVTGIEGVSVFKEEVVPGDVVDGDERGEDDNNDLGSTYTETPSHKG
ncbi:hypothetical protein FKP32DRAFT_1602690 [Trametes sanguinea]|nr:hypothetical protein FKP32DRAFT_1602690 [Trametes sanguinea]